MSQSKQRRSYVEHNQSQQRRDGQESRKEAIREKLKKCSRALERGQRKHYLYIAVKLADTLCPLLLDTQNKRVRHYNEPLAVHDDWHGKQLLKFRRDTAAIVAALGGEPESMVDSKPQPQAFGGGEAEARACVKGALESCAAIADYEGITEGVTTTTVPAWEYEHQIGVRHYRAGSPGHQEAELIDPEDDLKATLFTGSQGSGKSTALETVVEDRIARGHKIVDLVDFHSSENALYDIPEQSDLAEYREDLGLKTGFDEIPAGFAWLFEDEPMEDAYLPPDIEILAPLTPDLSETEIPVDTTTDEPIVTPFAIPASELTYRQLVLLLPHTTKTHENYLKSAHQVLSKRDDDWTLSDVAQVVRQKTNAGERVADRIERALQTAQNKSFIRDQESEFCLDWDRIMADPRTVTAFTVHMIREPSDKLLVISYLLDCLYDERQRLIRERRLQEFPPLTTVMRELHEIAPRQKSEQESENTIEGYMIDVLSDIFALMRWVKMEIIADTQKFYRQLSPNVSGLFHRIFCFNGQKPDIKRVFNTRIDPDGDPEETVAGYETGKCALVSDDGYQMPIKFAPPRSHHLDAKSDGDAFSFRTRVDGLNEELQPAPWDASVPKRLQFYGSDEPRDNLEMFFTDFITQTGNRSDYTVKKHITEAYNEWAEEYGYNTHEHNYIQERLKNHFDLDSDTDARPTVGGERVTAHRTIVLDEAMRSRQRKSRTIQS